jgi:hypothetical protein
MYQSFLLIYLPRFNLNKSPNSGYEFRVKPFGKLYFVCPNIALWNDISSIGPQLSMMYENLMLVDKEGYETCTVNRTRDPHLNRVILKCDGDANQLESLQETFSPRRVDQYRMEYESGKTYYFICKYWGSWRGVPIPFPTWNFGKIPVPVGL